MKALFILLVLAAVLTANLPGPRERRAASSAPVAVTTSAPSPYLLADLAAAER